MDIMMPRLEQQPSPAPWFVRSSRADVLRLIRTALEQNASASVDQVVAELARLDVQVSGIIVAMWLASEKSRLPKSERVDENLALVKERNPNYSRQTGEPQWASKI